MPDRRIIQRRIIILIDENGNEEVISQNEYCSHHEKFCSEEEFERIVAIFKDKKTVIPQFYQKDFLKS